jgi:uncharacterized protein
VSTTQTRSREFTQGMIVVMLVYAALFGYITLKGKDVSRRHQTTLASQIVPIERSAPEPVTAVEETHSDAYGPSVPEIPTEAQIQQDVENTPLYPAPMEGLYVTMPDGKLMPKINDKGLTPFKAYQKPFVSPGKPLIALALIDYGLSETSSQEALANLPSYVSFILSPYAADPEKWQQLARERGHEVWIQMPMETEEYPAIDPGPQAILSTASIKYNQDRLEWVLTRTPGYAGVAVITDGAFEDYQTMLQGLLKGVFGRGLGLMEINPSAPPDIETMAFTAKAPYARNHLFLDKVSLKDIEKQAVEKGFIIGIIKPTPSALKAVKTWTGTLESKNIALAPVSAVTDATPQAPQQEAVPAPVTDTVPAPVEIQQAPTVPPEIHE